MMNRTSSEVPGDSVMQPGGFWNKAELLVSMPVTVTVLLGIAVFGGPGGSPGSGSRLSAQETAPQEDGGSVKSVEIGDGVPYGREPVDYFSSETDDAVARLDRRLRAGDVRLTVEPPHGYLKSVLAELNVPIESQVLVFSKTARSPDLVGPRAPRAVFFNDEVSVAWIPEARELEFSAVDPVKGVNFYTLSQPLPETPAETGRQDGTDDIHGTGTGTGKSSRTGTTFIRRDRCLACHAGRSALQVPGLLLRAFQTDRTGKPLMGFSRVTHEMDYAKRWGGWFVTGTPQEFIHRGNLLSRNDNQRHKREPGFQSAMLDLSRQPMQWTYPHDRSDVVAHFVLAHQVHGTNLLVRAGMEARLKRRSDVEERLVRYLVFAEEPALSLGDSTPDPGNASIEAGGVADEVSNVAAKLKQSPYARWFAGQSPVDDDGRSLREFAFTDQVFKYRLSFLVHSRLFDALPDDCRNRLLTRLWHGLVEEPDAEAFQHLAASEREAIVSIVQQTVPRLPPCWR